MTTEPTRYTDGRELTLDKKPWKFVDGYWVGPDWPITLLYRAFTGALVGVLLAFIVVLVVVLLAMLGVL